MGSPFGFPEDQTPPTSAHVGASVSGRVSLLVGFLDSWATQPLIRCARDCCGERFIQWSSPQTTTITTTSAILCICIHRARLLPSHLLPSRPNSPPPPPEPSKLSPLSKQHAPFHSSIFTIYLADSCVTVAAQVPPTLKLVSRTPAPHSIWNRQPFIRSRGSIRLVSLSVVFRDGKERRRRESRIRALLSIRIWPKVNGNKWPNRIRNESNN